MANNVINEEQAKKEKPFEQINLFTDYKKKEKDKKKEEAEKRMQSAIINLKKKYGKNAVIKGIDLEEGATTIERNTQVGGHKG